jgi:isocitrate dehydrogenase
VEGRPAGIREEECWLFYFVFYLTEGDGTGPDIWRAAVRVMDAAVEKAYKGHRKVVWFQVYVREKANEVYGHNTWLPDGGSQRGQVL